jgi:hypothetical protein
MAAEHRFVNAEEWFTSGERLPYDPARASFGDNSPLRVFVRHASGGARIAADLAGAVRFHVVGSSEDRYEARQLDLARERVGDAVESTELPGGNRATAEHPTRLAELIEGLLPMLTKEKS